MLYSSTVIRGCLLNVNLLYKMLLRDSAQGERPVTRPEIVVELLFATLRPFLSLGTNLCTTKTTSITQDSAMKLKVLLRSKVGVFYFSAVSRALYAIY